MNLKWHIKRFWSEAISTMIPRSRLLSNIAHSVYIRVNIIVKYTSIWILTRPFGHFTGKKFALWVCTTHWLSGYLPWSRVWYSRMEWWIITFTRRIFRLVQLCDQLLRWRGLWLIQRCIHFSLYFHEDFFDKIILRKNISLTK